VIVGDPAIFAIESGISRPVGTTGLGFFLVHLAGRQYGVREDHATMLGSSFDEVVVRLQRRGMHRCSEVASLSAEDVGQRYWRGTYSADAVPAETDLSDKLHLANVVWAPDGDEAFNDTSHILQLDLGQSVRLIGFRAPEDLREKVRDVTEVIVSENEFYDTLADWLVRFTADLQQLGSIN
jgi:hypothetical protein